MRKTILLSALPLLLIGCGQGSETSSQSFATEIVSPTATQDFSTEDSIAEPVGPSAPAHFYESRDGLIYSYIAAISEDQRKAGRAAGDVVSYAYLGKQAGKHVLARIGNGDVILDRAWCADPCKIITVSDGTKLGYNTDSIIGAAFADAISGKLQTASEVAPPRPKVRERPELNFDEQISADEPTEAAPSEFPDETDAEVPQ